MSNKNSYFEKLKDPRWQKKRLEKLNSTDFSCECCFDSESTLHVHHKEYFKGREPWEYELKQLAVLCEQCHENTHESDALKTVCSFLPVDGPLSRDEIAMIVAGLSEHFRYEKFLEITHLENIPWRRKLYALGIGMKFIYSEAISGSNNPE